MTFVSEWELYEKYVDSSRVRAAFMVRCRHGDMLMQTPPPIGKQAPPIL